MAVAMVYPEISKGGRGAKNPSLNKEFISASLSQARTDLRCAPGIVDNVLSGAESLNTEYETAMKFTVVG